MADFVLTNDGKKVILNRIFKSTPDYKEPTLFKVGTGQAIPTTSDTDLTTPVIIDTDNVKEFVSGYPQIDENTFEANIQCFLETTEANGNSLDGFGIFNNDVPQKSITIGKNTAINKTEYDQVTYNVTLKVVENI